MATGFARVNGGDLRYEVQGQGYPVLLLHAGVADSRMWDAQAEVLAQHHQVIQYDIRGFGESVPPPGPLSHHGDAAGLLTFLGIEKACVVGVSFGGYVAVDFVLAYPHMVTALFLGAPIVSGYEPSSAALTRFFAEEEEALDRGDLESAAELNVRMWVDGPCRAPDQVDPVVREQVRQMQLQAFAMSVPEGIESQPLAPPAIERLAEIQSPSLIIIGDLDVPEFQSLAQTVTDRIPGARKVEIPGAAHLPSMEKPDVFNQIILDFFRNAAPTG